MVTCTEASSTPLSRLRNVFRKVGELASAEQLRLLMRVEFNDVFETPNSHHTAYLVLGELLALELDMAKDLQVKRLDQSRRTFLLQLFSKRSNVNNFGGRGVMKCHGISLLEWLGSRACQRLLARLFAQRSRCGSFAATPLHGSTSAGAGIFAIITRHDGASSALICGYCSSPAEISSSRKMASAGHSGTHRGQSMQSFGSIARKLAPS